MRPTVANQCESQRERDFKIITESAALSPPALMQLTVCANELATLPSIMAAVK